jgi:hypothetical protein
MPQSTAVVGIHSDELRWVRLLITLLRHPDPGTPELVRQALLYLSQSAQKTSAPVAEIRPRAY